MQGLSLRPCLNQEIIPAGNSLTFTKWYFDFPQIGPCWGELCLILFHTKLMECYNSKYFHALCAKVLNNFFQINILLLTKNSLILSQNFNSVFHHEIMGFQTFVIKQIVWEILFWFQNTPYFCKSVNERGFGGNFGQLIGLRFPNSWY